MLKGQKLTTSRSERLLGVYDGHALASGESHDFSEDEVWSTLSRADKPPKNSSKVRATSQERNKTNIALHSACHVAASAPVNMPEYWSQINRVNSAELMCDEDYDNQVVPPHEYLAQEYRRVTANSVFEGVGRTLKGRDMRRVRDSVWGQTGFNG